MSSLHIADIVQVLRDAGLLLETRGALTGTIEAYTTDTRRLKDGYLLLAYRGVQFDAHQHIAPLAAANPRSTFILEDKAVWDALDTSIPAILVTDSREAWSYLASLKHGRPEQKLRLIGVTGTNGKTSTVWFVRQILRSLGIPCMTLGTLGVYCGEDFLPSNHTTPDPDEMFRHLALAVERGITWAAMEVSSHAIVQRRLGPIRFDSVAFTSFSRDHLDFHPTMEDYFAAKWELFTRYRKPGAPAWISKALTSAQEDPKAQIGRYGEGEGAYAYEALESRINRSRIRLKAPRGSSEFSFSFGGDFVLDNFTAAYALIDSIHPVHALDSEVIRPVPGRFEPVRFPYPEKQEFVVVVDYAHTPDALEKTLSKLKTMTNGRLWAIFGCGGDRDKGKRPLMGNVAEQIADVAVVTSDNPRTERPGDIIADILRGMPRRKEIHVIPDRREAITRAIAQATPGDTVLIAGKGHEDYQIIGTVKHPFDDRQEALEALRARFSGSPAS